MAGEAFLELVVELGHIGLEHIAIGLAQYDRAIGPEDAALAMS